MAYSPTAAQQSDEISRLKREILAHVHNENRLYEELRAVKIALTNALKLLAGNTLAKQLHDAQAKLDWTRKELEKAVHMCAARSPHDD